MNEDRVINSEDINLKCKDCIEDAIDMFYDGSRLASDEALKYVLGQHTPERVIFIVATSIMRRSFDGRISSENKEFAEKIMFAIRQKYGDGERTGAVIKSHAGLLNLFAREVRESYEEMIKTNQELAQLFVPTIDENEIEFIETP